MICCVTHHQLKQRKEHSPTAAVSPQLKKMTNQNNLNVQIALQATIHLNWAEIPLKSRFIMGDKFRSTVTLRPLEKKIVVVVFFLICFAFFKELLPNKYSPVITSSIFCSSPCCKQQ